MVVVDGHESVERETVDDLQRLVVRYGQSGVSADLDGMRHDIHVQHHVGGRIDVHHHILAVRDRGLQRALVGDPVGIADMFGIDDVFALHAPEAAALDDGIDVMVEEVEVVVFQL